MDFTKMKYAIYLIFLSNLTIKKDDFGTSTILSLQPHDKDATLVVKTIEFFLEKFTWN